MDMTNNSKDMLRATISADIVSSTSLSVEELTLLQSEIHRFLDELSQKSQGKDWGRLFKGDSVEIFLHDPHEALRVALLLKTLVKKTNIPKEKDDAKLELFRKYGVRLAIGVGEMRASDQKRDFLDGEAIYYSGRLLEKQKQNGNDRNLLSSSMCFGHKNDSVTEFMSVVLDFLDVMFRDATSRQCEIVYYRLWGKQEKEIAELLHVSQPAINKQCTAIGWNAINASLTYFEKLNFGQ